MKVVESEKCRIKYVRPLGKWEITYLDRDEVCIVPTLKALSRSKKYVLMFKANGTASLTYRTIKHHGSPDLKNEFQSDVLTYLA